MKPPLENPSTINLFLVERFLNKGYYFTEIREQRTTIIFLTNEKKQFACSDEKRTGDEVVQNFY